MFLIIQCLKINVSHLQVIGFPVQGYECLTHLQFVVVELTMVQSIPEGRKAKPSKTSCSENRSEPDCEWACHVPPSLWRRDACIWTDSGPNPTRLLSLLRRRLSEMVDDRFIQKWPTIGYLNLIWASNVVFFLLHLAWSTIQLLKSKLFSCAAGCCWVTWNALWDTLTLQVAFDANWILDISQEQFACNFSISSHFASSCHSGFSHASQTVVSLFLLFRCSRWISVLF